MVNIRSAAITLNIRADNGARVTVSFGVQNDADGLHDPLFAALEQAWKEYRAAGRQERPRDPEQLSFDFG